MASVAVVVGSSSDSSLAQNRTTFVPIKTQLSLVVDRMHMSTKSNFFDIFLIVARNSLLQIE